MEGSLPRLDGRKQVNAKPKSEVADVTYICDASSSAYQIMSYFQDLAVRTNFLRVDGEDQVYDLYSSLLEDFEEEIPS